MAYRRGRGYGRGRRFFRRRRRGIRPSTEAGTGRRSFERCRFTYAFEQSISTTTNTHTDSAVLAISGAAMISPLSAAGTEAAAVARLLQQPIKGYEVLAIQYDVDGRLTPGWDSDSVLTNPNVAGDLYNTGVLLAHTLYTQRLGVGGSIVAPEASLESQWPVYQGQPTTDEEDYDFALRTHFHRARYVTPHLADDGDGSWRLGIPGEPVWRTSVKAKLRRRLGDNQGLFFGFSNRTNVAYAPSGRTAVWTVSGSLWYRIAW